MPKKPALKLKDLLAGITSENMHAEEFTEGPVGKELW